MSTETARVEAADGHRIRLDVHRPPGGQAAEAAVLLHGLFANRSEEGSLQQLGDRLAERGRVAVRFDFRGHGDSDWPSTSFSALGAVKDLHAVVRWCELQAGVVSLLGCSFGGGTVLNYLQLRPDLAPGRIVLLNPVLDYRATFIEPTLQWGRELFTPERVRQLLDAGVARLAPDFVAGFALYAEMAALASYRALQAPIAPTLLLHGTADDKVPIAAARRLAPSFAPSVTYREVPGATHGFHAAGDAPVFDDAFAWLVGQVP